MDYLQFSVVILILIACPAGLGQLDRKLPDNRPGLFPSVFNLATLAKISVNATCGQESPEAYCRLVEHVPDSRIQNPQCKICDSQSLKRNERHPIESAIDGTNGWWQSPSIANGMLYHWVTITLDMGQEFQVAYVIVKAANSPRPGNWILERSLDGEMYKPWQYYAVSDEECRRAYGVDASTRMEHFSRDDEVICTSYYSSIVPLRHGEIHTSLINGRPSAANPSEVLMKFTKARYVRLRLQKIRTLHGDLMSPYMDNAEKITDTSVARRYFYSIKDISIGGQCICYGHAQECSAGLPDDFGKQALRCVCEHNTCGESCNECCPGYHQFPWQPGNLEGFKCEACNCHNHADDCYYDVAVGVKRLSIDAAGFYNGGGVCIDCRDHTAGINCEECEDGYYRPEGIDPDDAAPCVECDCDPVGTLPNAIDVARPGSCLKDDSRVDIGLLPGRCPCRVGYAGRRCDQCARGYQNYPLCEPCACSAAGSLNEDPCVGPCICKPNVKGEFCDTCVPGTFNLAEYDPLGCTMCFCFGVTTQCSSVPWRVKQITTMNNWFLTTHLMSSYEYPDRISSSAIAVDHQRASGALGSEQYFFLAAREYLNNKLTAYGGVFQFTLSWLTQTEIPMSDWTRKVVVLIEGHRIRLARTFKRKPEKRKDTISFIMTERSWYHIPQRANPLESTPGPPATQAEFMNALSDVSVLLIGFDQSPRQSYVMLSDVSLGVVSEDSESPEVMKTVEQCSCPATYEGLSCEQCGVGYMRFGDLESGTCEPCECNGHAFDCDDFTGECLDCQHGTYGPHCEYCHAGFYGIATVGTPNDCQRCACPLEDISNNFSPSCTYDPDQTFICNQCPAGYTGTKCERCVDGYYGLPMQQGNSCRPCADSCNGNVDPLEPGSCHPVTGDCFLCTSNTTGLHCERCADGYYGDAVHEKSCRACQCSVYGSTHLTCDYLTGDCDCKIHVEGQFCHVCEHGFWNIVSENGCESCDCNAVGSLDDSCDIETGQCHCKEGVDGLKCDQCAVNHWNFTPEGCEACNCTEGQCHPIYGTCICPPNTMGLACDECAPRSWGYQPLLGCKECNCSTEGSVGPQCDAVSGQCRCEKPYVGMHCDECPRGFYNFPQCQRCRCSKIGREHSSCKGKQCDCLQDGQCICKENVRGIKCNKCKTHTFSIQSKLPTGCTSCFCFGVTSNCKQADYIYENQKITSVQARSVMLTNIPGSVLTKEGLMTSGSEVTVNITHAASVLDNQDVYWRLPKDFLGSKITSYGGHLQYKVTFEAIQDTVVPIIPRVDMTEGPYLVLQGKRLNLEASMVMKEKDSSTLTFKVELFEHNFKMAGSDEPPTRPDLMMVLQDIRGMLIRANVVPNLVSASLSKVMLHVGVPASPSEEMPIAMGVEICKCPRGYEGPSCERCSSGYVRIFDGSYLGSCAPCKCNFHADECEEGTGYCKFCQHNTMGAQCEQCADGYYGDAKFGSSNDCKPCECPLSSPANNFSPTCTLEEDGLHRCTQCPEGYEDRFCERCADGFFGNPRELGDSCQPCNCNEHGSISQECNKASGQCHCIKGVSGLLCDECQEGYELKDGGCYSCYDGSCISILLDNLDQLESTMEVKINSSVIYPVPWSSFFLLYNSTKLLETNVNKHSEHMKSLSDVMISAHNRTHNLPMGVSELHRKASKAGHRANNISGAINVTVVRGRLLDTNISAILLKINASISELRSAVDKTGMQPITTNEEMLNKANKILNEIRGREFGAEKSYAEKELRLANTTLYAVKSSAGEPNELPDRLLLVNNSFVSLRDNMEELYLYIQTSNDKTEMAERRSERSQDIMVLLEGNLEQYEAIHVPSSEDISLANDLLDSSEVILMEANTSMQMSRKEHENLTSYFDALKKEKDAVNETVQVLTSLVLDAQNHSNKLQNLSKSLESLLLPTKMFAENALKAATAYSDMIAAINAAENASLNAKIAAAEALEKTISKENRTLAEIAKELRNESRRHLRQALKQNSKITASKKRLENGTEEVRKINGMQDKMEKDLVLIRNQLNQLDNEGFEERAKHALSLSKSSQNITRILSRKVNGLLVMTEELGNVANQIKFNVEYTNNITKNSNEDVSASRKHLSDISSVASFLEDKSSSIKRLESRMEGDLQALKEQIKQTRNEVSKIRLSMKSTGNCARMYKPTFSPSSYNAVIMNVDLARPNNHLFYLGGNTTDFFSLETIDNQVIFKWDVGSGLGVISSPVIIKLNHWYRIEATRSGRSASLLVEESGKPEMAVTTSNASPVGSTILDINDKSVMFVGGIPNNQTIEVTATKSFAGCMGEVTFDGIPISLWNFITIEGDCQGCVINPPNNPNEEGFFFDGTGYAILPIPSIFDLNLIYISFMVRTFTENALLLFISSADQNDFLSVELQGGKVLTQIDLGSGAEVVLSDTGINNNTWHSVTLSFVDNETALYIDDVKVGNTVSMDADDGLSLAPWNKFYIGGLPFGFDMMRDVKSSAYRGCLKDFTIYRTVYPLLRPGKSFGVSEGCPVNKMERSVGLSGDGQVALRPLALGREADITLTFTTLQEDAVILAAGEASERSRRDINFDAVDVSYTIALVEGRLQVQVNAGQGRLTLDMKKTDGKLNDGKPHVILFQKREKRIKMTVDDKMARSGKLPGTQVLVPTMSPLFIGNIGSDISVSRRVQSLPPFSGCLENLVIMGELIGFNNATGFENANIGFCGPLSLPPAPTTRIVSTLKNVTKDPKEPHLVSTQCHTPNPPESSPYGLRFGITQPSYALIEIVPTEIAKVFTMSISLRTTQENSVVFYMADKRHELFSTLIIMKGFVLFMFNIGNSMQSVLSDLSIDDGFWHEIFLIRNRKSAYLQVDGQQKKRIRSEGSFSRLNVVSPLYIGGLPAGIKTRRISENIGNFHGCIRKFILNDVVLDLSSDEVVTGGTAPCFSRVESGAYFYGSGYIKQAEDFLLGPEIFISTQFRTTQKDGVIFALANRANAFIILEIKGMKISLQSSNGQETFVVTYNSPSSFSVCDNQWHTVDIRANLIQLELKVNGNRTMGIHRMPGSAGGHYTLFVGGIMDGFLEEEWRSFHGCIRNLQINNSIQDYSGALEISEAVPDECPIV